MSLHLGGWLPESKQWERESTPGKLPKPQNSHSICHILLIKIRLPYIQGREIRLHFLKTRELWTYFRPCHWANEKELAALLWMACLLFKMNHRFPVPLRLEIKILNMTARPCMPYRLCGPSLKPGLSPFCYTPGPLSFPLKCHTTDSLKTSQRGSLGLQPALALLTFIHPSGPGSKVASSSYFPWALRLPQVLSEAFMNPWFWWFFSSAIVYGCDHVIHICLSH